MTKKIKQLSRISTWTWSPYSQLMGASGTLTNELEIYKWNDTLFKQKTSSKLTTLAWSTEGVIAGGTEKGDLELYNVSNIIQEKEDYLLFNTNMMVKALDFKSNFLASVGNQNDFYIWDLNQSDTITKLKSTKITDISNVAWNSQVQHIIAACDKHGYTLVWDLRTKREILSLYAPESNISSIAWHPNIGTQIITASRNNNLPFLSLWDLRNVHSPEKTLTSHTQGILDISWCSQDPDRLLSCDLDGRIHYWDQFEFSHELVYLQTPTFQVDFCPSNPDLFATRSLVVQVYSVQQREHPADPVDIKRPSNMIRPPLAASFGFGGKLVRCQGKKLYITTMAMDNRLKKRVDLLELASTTELIDAHANERDWQILKILNSDNARYDLIQYLQRHHPTFNITSEPRQTMVHHDPAVDHVIMQHVAVGDFSHAVNVCLEHDRYSDALMLSMCGDSALLQRTQQVYLDHQAKERSYLGVIKAVLDGDLEALVKANQNDWPTLLVILCTFASAEEFERLCDMLGDRLQDEQHALVFYLASGNLNKVARIWSKQDDLQTLIEKLTVFQRMTQETVEDTTLYYDYAEMLVQYGQLETALKYLQCIPHLNTKQRVLRDRILSIEAPKSTVKYYSAHQNPFFSGLV